MNHPLPFDGAQGR